MVDLPFHRCVLKVVELHVLGLTDLGAVWFEEVVHFGHELGPWGRVVHAQQVVGAGGVDALGNLPLKEFHGVEIES